MHSIDSMYYFLSFSIENYLWNEINFTDSMLGSIARETELIIVNYKCMTTKCTAGEYWESLPLLCYDNHLNLAAPQKFNINLTKG